MQAIEKTPIIVSKRLDEQFRALILQPLSMVAEDGCPNPSSEWPRVIIIDAVDQCKADSNRAGTSRELRRRTTLHQREIVSVINIAARHPSFPFRIIISSRPTAVLETFLSKNLDVLRKVTLDVDCGPESDIASLLRCEVPSHRKQDWPSAWALTEIW
jgi:hypothetical protein